MKINLKPKKDCPECKGEGFYFVTTSDYEEPIECSCRLYTDEDWEKEKKNPKSCFYVEDKNEK